MRAARFPHLWTEVRFHCTSSFSLSRVQHGNLANYHLKYISLKELFNSLKCQSLRPNLRNQVGHEHHTHFYPTMLSKPMLADNALRELAQIVTMLSWDLFGHRGTHPC